MSEIVIPVPAEWKRRAYIDAAKYEEMYRASVAELRRVLGRRSAQARMDEAVQERERRLV